MCLVCLLVGNVDQAPWFQGRALAVDVTGAPLSSMKCRCPSFFLRTSAILQMIVFEQPVSAAVGGLAGAGVGLLDRRRGGRAWHNHVT